MAGLPGSGRQAGSFGPANWVIVTWGWAFAVTFGVHAAGGISGAHINPAVTPGFALRRGFPWRKVVPYWFAQLTGAFCGAGLAYAVYESAINWFNTANHFTRPHPVPTFSVLIRCPRSRSSRRFPRPTSRVPGWGRSWTRSSEPASSSRSSPRW
ncbi:MAG TPA: aquaporin [Trebonia sp.]|nr:aquaporin [Trebonia sp.]